MQFEVKTKGNYIIQFKATTGGYVEYLLAECKVRKANVTGISNVSSTEPAAAEGIYNVSGVKTQQLQRGLNIIRTADGKTRKIWKR